MEDAFPILDYLPNSFRAPDEQRYITFLWNAFESNYQNGQYQMALLPYHMLYMSYVYFSIWQIRLIRPTDFFHASIFQRYEKKVTGITSPFKFHKITETEVFKYLRIIGCNEEQTQPFANLVIERNSLAHANGDINCADQATADTRIAEILKQVRVIQSHMTTTLHQCLKAFLLESALPVEEREYENPTDQIRELLVHKNYFSTKDIESCLAFDIQILSSEPNFEIIKELFEQFVELYLAEMVD